MTGSKRRPLWSELSDGFRDAVEELCQGRVRSAINCPGGFSPGLASRLTLTDGRRAFVKAIDATAWPHEVPTYRAEARVTGFLPAEVAAPKLLGTVESPLWTILAYEDIDGSEPRTPWLPTELDRVLQTLDGMRVAAPDLPDDHPRLGGWTELTRELLEPVSPWAAQHLDQLIGLESDGLRAARGDDLVHFDLYPHNMLLSGDRAVFVDWPHARRGNRLIDQLQVLISVAADGLDPEPFCDGGSDDGRAANAILAAHAGFLLAGGLHPLPPGLEPIGAAKTRLGLAALDWLRRRLTASYSGWLPVV
jgi:hypothetical protein